MSKLTIRVILFLLLGICVCMVAGCGNREIAVQSPGSMWDNDGFTKNDRQVAKNMLKVEVMADDAMPDISSSQISNVSERIAISKAEQALNNYDHALAKKIGYDFPLSTVWQPDVNHMTRQLIDGHLYYVCILGFKDCDNQAAYNQVGGIIPGIVVIDAVDPNKDAQVRLTDALGQPYKIKLHYRNKNWDDNFIGRFLDEGGYGRPREFYPVQVGSGEYLDDVTPEVEDGSWRVYYTCTRNQNQVKAYGDAGWCYPKVNAVLVIDAETKKVKEYKPEDPKIPKWIDRIYSPRLVAEYVNGWGFEMSNYKLNSFKNWTVLDQNILDIKVDAENDGLVYVGIMTSTQNDNSATGVIIIPTNNLKRARFYPLYGKRAIATRQQAYDVMAHTNDYRGWEVEDLSFEWLYGRFTWECCFVKHNKFSTQIHGHSAEGEENGDTIIGSDPIAYGLTMADCNMQPAKVVWDDKIEAAFAKYENLCFVTQTVNVGSFALEENEADGTISSIHHIVAGGNTAFMFSLKEPKYAGLTFMLTINSLYDRDTVDINNAQIGDHVRFKYGDTKNSPTCFVKLFRDVTRSAWTSR